MNGKTSPRRTGDSTAAERHVLHVQALQRISSRQRRTCR